MVKKSKPIYWPWVVMAILIVGGLAYWGWTFIRDSFLEITKTTSYYSADGGAQEPLLGVAAPPEAVKTWVDYLLGVLDRFVASLVSLGGAVMLWLNIRKTKKEVDKNSK